MALAKSSRRKQINPAEKQRIPLFFIFRRLGFYIEEKAAYNDKSYESLLETSFTCSTPFYPAHF